jgi:hypothetical protein
MPSIPRETAPMLFSVTKTERTILAFVALLIVLGLIGMALL